MRNVGLKHSNYYMTVVDVALPLYVTRKILYVGILVHCIVCNGTEELFVGILAHGTKV